MTSKTDKAVLPREPIVEVDASVFRNVLGFTAVADIRYYLNGVHVRAHERPLLMASDGHIAYCEEDRYGKAIVDVTLSISRTAKPFLKAGNRVIVEASRNEAGKAIEDGSSLRIVDRDEATVYIEPGKAVIECKYPDIPAVMGDFTTWNEGLLGGFNTRLLNRALALPGCVRFYHRGADTNGSALFTFEPERTGRHGIGLVMPMSGKTLTEVLPSALRIAA